MPYEHDLTAGASGLRMSRPSRRSVIAGAAWPVPAIALATPPAYAGSQVVAVSGGDQSVPCARSGQAALRTVAGRCRMYRRGARSIWWCRRVGG